MASQLIYLRDVVSLRLDSEKCVGCGMCLIVCPHGVIERPTDVAVIVSKDACMECGACARNCPTGAITVRAGVGCAAAIINGMLGRDSSSCCCVVESDCRPPNGGPPDPGRSSSGCC